MLLHELSAQGGTPSEATGWMYLLLSLFSSLSFSAFLTFLVDSF
jgi:hypothetical protein